MHHDKLEEECVKEKNLLLKLIMLYQKASVDLLENKEDSNLNKVEDKVKDKFEDNLGIDDENKTIWINYKHRIYNTPSMFQPKRGNNNKRDCYY